MYYIYIHRISWIFTLISRTSWCVSPIATTLDIFDLHRTGMHTCAHIRITQGNFKWGIEGEFCFAEYTVCRSGAIKRSWGLAFPDDRSPAINRTYCARSYLRYTLYTCAYTAQVLPLSDTLFISAAPTVRLSSSLRSRYSARELLPRGKR